MRNVFWIGQEIQYVYNNKINYCRGHWAACASVLSVCSQVCRVWGCQLRRIDSLAPTSLSNWCSDCEACHSWYICSLLKSLIPFSYWKPKPQKHRLTSGCCLQWERVPSSLIPEWNYSTDTFIFTMMTVCFHSHVSHSVRVRFERQTEVKVKNCWWWGRQSVASFHKILHIGCKFGVKWWIMCPWFQTQVDKSSLLFITDLLLIYYLGEQFPNEFMVSVSSLKSILMQYEAPFVN